ncbi:MAG: SurA N-terminal domain-containing protein [Rikenellaceae bacterium]|nr:SurA N-terminal domain-containing protein [Rikenellaceae bacterium]
MATLNTLRTKGGIIVTVVIGIALIAFLLGDLTGNGSMFNSNVKVGKINGKDVTYMDLYSEIEYLSGINKAISGTDANSQQQDFIRELAWEEIKRSYILYPGLENLGITVSDAEMFDLIYGNNISPVMLNFGFFNDQQTGMYNKSAVREFVANLSMDPSGNMRLVWEYLQDQVRKEALVSKYLAIVKNMAYFTDLEAELGEKLTNTNFSARYVTLGYSTIADTLVNVTKSEVKKYYDEHISQYKQTASRDIEYVMFEVEPSAQDYAEAKDYFYTLYEEFQNTENVQQFVTLNSQMPFDAGYYSKEQFPTEIADFIFSGDNGVYGPDLINDVYTMFRVTDRKYVPDSLSIKQIVLSPFDGLLADSLVNELNKGADFEMLSYVYSLNQGDPDMGTLPTTVLTSQILDPIMETPAGKITRIDTPNGILLLEVYKRGRDVMRAQVGTVVMDVIPSNATQQDIYTQASTFYSNVKGSYEKFDEMATEENLYKRVVRVTPSDKSINGLDDSKELVRWAFNAKEKEVSGILEINGNYVVASLVDSKENGYAPVEQVTPEIASELRREKKAEILAEKLNSSSLQQAADANDITIEEIYDMNFNTYYVPGIGMELKVIGAVAGGVELNKVSQPIKGNSGVYLVEVISEEKTTDISLEAEKLRQEASKTNDIEARLTDAIYNLSDIDDKRVKYF